MVICAVMVLAALASVMHYQQGVARQTIMRSLAELQFRQAARYAEARLVGWDLGALPAECRLQATTKDVSPTGSVAIAEKQATLVWGVPGDAAAQQMADISIKPDSLLAAPGIADQELTPKSSDSSLMVFGKHTYHLQQSKGLGYALYAPQGNIKATHVLGWANPRFDDPRDALKAFSGVPTLVAALNKVELERMEYGSAYSKNQSPAIHDGLAVTRRGFFPLRNYEATLGSKLDSSFSDLQSRAESSDKTNLIKGDALDVILLFISGKGTLAPTLEQAMEFRFPLVPGFSATVPGVFFEFWLSMALPPDFKDTPDSQTDAQAQAFGKEVEQAAKNYANTKATMEAVQAEYNAATTDDQRDDIRPRLNDAKDAFNAAEKKLNALKDDTNKKAADNKKKIETNSVAATIPQTRQDDVSITTKNGQTGWAYITLLQEMLDTLLLLIDGDMDGVANKFLRKVRVVHFGRKNNVPDFTFKDGLFHSQATWSVPPGRTFCYRGNMEIAGDLWVQKGSTFLVQGDLTVQDPGTGSVVNPIAPKGRVFLEEGSTLLVTGDFSCEGSRAFGSIMLGSPTGAAHPVNCALMCKGNVSIPFAIMSGMNLEDTVRWLGGKEASIGSLNKVISPLLTQIAPNAAKLVGPFHFRKCYFASYATTFQLTIILGVPIPTPIPLPHKNVLVPIFKALTKIYTVNSNISLGENLYTSADWWIFGEGVVPMIPKVDINRATKVLSGLSLPSFSLDWSDSKWKSELENYAKEVAEKALTELVTRIFLKIATQLIASVAPGGSVACDLIIEPLMDALEEELNKLLGTGSFMDDLKGDAMDALRSKLESVMDEVLGGSQDKLNNALMRESAGVLVYAGNSLTIGPDPSSVPIYPAMASGLFVARKNVTIRGYDVIGQVVSLEGDIEAQRVLYNPYFSRASLYLPKSSKTFYLERAFEFGYGKDYDSKESTEIEPDITGVITGRGWK
jgi:hypothetical protein